MKLTVDRSRLVSALQQATKAVSARTTIPILTGVKVVADERGVTLTGSDSDVAIQCTVPREEDDRVLVHLQQAGSVVIPASYFLDIIRKLPGDTVEMEVSERFTVALRSGPSAFHLNGLDADDYPRLPQVEEGTGFAVPGDLLRAMIRQTVFAVSTSETRPILTGVQWTLEDGHLRFVATDSHRLATRTAQVEADASARFSVVVPGKSLQELAKTLEETRELVDVYVAKNQLMVKGKHTLFYSRLLEGNYPDTSRIIPTASKTSLVVETKEFLAAIERASLIAKDGKNNVVKLWVRPDHTVELSSHSPEIGKVTEAVIARAVEGEELKIAFNAKYMMDALRAVDAPEVAIRFTGAMSPFVLKPTDHDWTLHLILPVRTY